jgi:alkylation response protein AidB-like acyl-CoA dehydrogenase
VATATPERKQAKALPPPNSDFYELAETLGAEEHALLKQLRSFLDSKVAPIINKYWAEDSFPFELLPAFKELGIGGLGIQGYECRGGSALLEGLAAMQLARTDASIATAARGRKTRRSSTGAGQGIHHGQDA